MKGKTWLCINLILVISMLLGIAGLTVFIDPYMHYHKPLTDRFYYALDNQRSMNNGITRHFDYDAMITGTSMTENFMPSQLDALFGTNAIKVCYSGATFREINDNIAVALAKNPDMKMVVRCIEYGMLINESDLLRTELGSYPTYLYDNNPFNDVEYIFNRDVLIKENYDMLAKRAAGEAPGITSFDDYSRWSEDYSYGPSVVYPDKSVDLSQAGAPVHLSEQELQTVLENIEVNVTSLARANPNVDFYYYISPYSVAWWQSRMADGEIYKYLEAARAAVEQIVLCENIKLFSFCHLTDITEDLNNYKDSTHHGAWVNNIILELMHQDKCRLTKDNYQQHFDFLAERYLNYDYASLLSQPDCEDDAEVIALLREKYSF